MEEGCINWSFTDGGWPNGSCDHPESAHLLDEDYGRRWQCEVEGCGCSSYRTDIDS